MTTTITSFIYTSATTITTIFKTTTTTSFFPPPSGKFLQSLPKNEPTFQSSNFIPITPAPSASPLATDDYYLLGPTSQIPSYNLYGFQTQTLSKKQEKKWYPKRTR